MSSLEFDVIIGNWKMHKTEKETEEFFSAFLPELGERSAHFAIPFTSIAKGVQLSKGTSVVIGAQNMSDALEGALTGEISAPMLKEAGARFVLIGHSERRHLFGETDAVIHRKVLTALQQGILPVLCIGETLEERDSGKTEHVLKRQLGNAANGVVIAYEPVWAIGTGRSASALQIFEAHRFCRGLIKAPILYGGSVNEKNAEEILSVEGVDGALVGGASLNPHTFAKILRIVR